MSWGGEGEGWLVWQKCRVPYVTGASNWYWLTVGQGLLPLWQVRVQGECFYFSVSSLSFLLLFLPCPSLSSPVPSLLSLFSLSLRDDTKWPSRVDVVVKPHHSPKKYPKECHSHEAQPFLGQKKNRWGTKTNMRDGYKASLCIYYSHH